MWVVHLPAFTGKWLKTSALKWIEQPGSQEETNEPQIWFKHLNLTWFAVTCPTPTSSAGISVIFALVAIICHLCSLYQYLSLFISLYCRVEIISSS